MTRLLLTSGLCICILFKLDAQSRRKNQIHNNSDITYILKGLQTAVGYSYQNSVELKAHRTSVIKITGNSEEIKNSKKIKLAYEVENLIDESGEKLKTSIDVNN